MSINNRISRLSSSLLETLRTKTCKSLHATEKIIFALPDRLRTTHSFECCKKMNQNPRRDKLAKAKIVKPNLNLRLPKEFLNPDGDSPNDLCYTKIFGSMENFVHYSRDSCCDNITLKAQQVDETVASGVKLVRKLHRIRNKELVTAFGDDFEGMKEIHTVSNTTIGILTSTESNLLKHSFLDFVGSFEEVTTAEELILDETLKTYSRVNFPVILMPPIIYGDHMNIPLHKVSCVLGTYRTNLLKMEMESGAWIKIEPGPCSLGLDWRVVNVFGPQENINKAKLLIQSVISEHDDVEDAFKDKFVEQYGDQESEDVGPTSVASGCYGSDLLCVSHA